MIDWREWKRFNDSEIMVREILDREVKERDGLTIRSGGGWNLNNKWERKLMLSLEKDEVRISFNSLLVESYEKRFLTLWQKSIGSWNVTAGQHFTILGERIGEKILFNNALIMVLERLKHHKGFVTQESQIQLNYRGLQLSKTRIKK